MRLPRAAWLGGLILICGCTQPGPANHPPDVLLLSLDTVRADVAIEVMPELRSFAVGGPVVADAYSPAGFTLPAHATMLFGIGVETHQVLAEEDRIADGFEPLAGTFEQAGYRTVGIVTNEWLRGEFGFSRGFGSYRQIPHAATYADRMVDEILAELRRTDSDQPTFLFGHFMDAHSDFPGQGTGELPYSAPADLLADLDLSRVTEYFCGAAGCATWWLQAFQTSGGKPDAEALALARILYERGLKGLDRELGRLFRELRADGRLGDMVVLVTSDHGEEFWEHGRTLHSQPHEETLRVPFVLRADGRLTSRKIESPVGLVDAAPTLAALAGLSPSPTWEGRNLVVDRRPRPLVARDKLMDRWAVRVPAWTYIEGTGSNGPSLYDRFADRAERVDLSKERPGVLAELAEVLADRRRRGEVVRQRLLAPSTGASSPFEEEERLRLEALGYAR